MADSTDGPKRWVLIRMLHAAVERTEEEIAELKSHGLFVRDAAGPDDHHEDPAPPPEAAAKPPATTPAGTPPPGGKTDVKE